MSQKITPNSLKLKSNIKTPRGRQILQRAEKQLAHECTTSINNTIDTCTCIRYTCMNGLKGQINDYYFKECSEFIRKVRECRHQTILERHLRKFDQLCQQTKGGRSNNPGGCSKSNHTLAPTTVVTSDNITPATLSTVTTIATPAGTTTTIRQLDKWVKKLLGVPLTKAQVSLLAHGNQFFYSSQTLPNGEYIAAVEPTCQNLDPHSAKELRAEIRGTLRHSHNPRKNITKCGVYSSDTYHPW